MHKFDPPEYDSPEFKSVEQEVQDSPTCPSLESSILVSSIPLFILLQQKIYELDQLKQEMKELQVLDRYVKGENETLKINGHKLRQENKILKYQ